MITTAFGKILCTKIKPFFQIPIEDIHLVLSGEMKSQVQIDFICNFTKLMLIQSGQSPGGSDAEMCMMLCEGWKMVVLTLQSINSESTIGRFCLESLKVLD